MCYFRRLVCVEREHMVCTFAISLLMLWLWRMTSVCSRSDLHNKTPSKLRDMISFLFFYFFVRRKHKIFSLYMYFVSLFQSIVNIIFILLYVHVYNCLKETADPKMKRCFEKCWKCWTSMVFVFLLWLYQWLLVFRFLQIYFPLYSIFKNSMSKIVSKF